jgi:hypothetical protein
MRIKSFRVFGCTGMSKRKNKCKETVFFLNPNEAEA